MNSRKNPSSKEIEYTDDPIGDVKIVPDFSPTASELKFNESKIYFYYTFNSTIGNENAN